MTNRKFTVRAYGEGPDALTQTVQWAVAFEPFDMVTPFDQQLAIAWAGSTFPANQNSHIDLTFTQDLGFSVAQIKETPNGRYIDPGSDAPLGLGQELTWVKPQWQGPTQIQPPSQDGLVAINDTYGTVETFAIGNYGKPDARDFQPMVAAEPVDYKSFMSGKYHPKLYMFVNTSATTNDVIDVNVGEMFGGWDIISWAEEGTNVVIYVNQQSKALEVKVVPPSE